MLVYNTAVSEASPLSTCENLEHLEREDATEWRCFHALKYFIHVQRSTHFSRIREPRSEDCASEYEDYVSHKIGCMWGCLITYAVLIDFSRPVGRIQLWWLLWPSGLCSRQVCWLLYSLFNQRVRVIRVISKASLLCGLVMSMKVNFCWRTP